MVQVIIQLFTQCKFKYNKYRSICWEEKQGCKQNNIPTVNVHTYMYIHLHSRVIVVYKYLYNLEIPGIFVREKTTNMYFYIRMASLFTPELR